MKALTFLGTGRYEPVTYVWQDGVTEQSCRTELFPEAIAKIFNPEQVLVFVTSRAKEHQHFQTLVQRLGALLQPVDIPEGNSEEELWQIFDQVANSVKEGERVLLDITHAFRSIPMIVFAVAAYLRRTKGVTIERIVYGAYEARQHLCTPPQPEDRAPIFDLTPLLDLLDWLGGAEFFLKRSDAALLADLLINIQNTIRRKYTQQPASANLPEKLKTVGRKLKDFSQALQLARPCDVMLYANQILEDLQPVASEADQWAKPFAVILERIRKEVENYAHDAPCRLDKENLQKQLALIEHFVEKGLWVQAILLAREWVVSWVILQRGEGDWLDKDYRERIEEALGAAAQRLRKADVEVPEWFDKLPKNKEVADLWNELIQLRNDVAHCGMRKDAASILSIEKRAKEIPNRIKELMNDVPGHVLYGGRACGYSP